MGCLSKAEHRYLPVFRRSPDAIEGIIDVATGELEDALFVPETIVADQFFPPCAMILYHDIDWRRWQATAG